ncbi:MAG: hypothetical protein ACT6FE_04570 [Methanosarcinaceae archaeon]
MIGHEVGKIPKGKKKPSLKIWIKEDVEKKRYAGFGKTIVFTDMHMWQSKKAGYESVHGKPIAGRFVFDRD